MKASISFPKLKRLIDTIVNKLFRVKKKEELNIPELFNFDSIPEKELREQYVDLSFVVSSSGYGGNFMGVNGEILSEAANPTLPILETKRQMQEKFKFKDWQFTSQQGANGMKSIVLYPGILKNSRLVKNAMEACGWSLSTKGYIIRNNMAWRAMSFDTHVSR